LTREAALLPALFAPILKGIADRRDAAVATVQLVDESCPDPIVQEVFRDIKATKQIDRVPNFWRALATNPANLRQVWNQLKATMRPGKIDLLTKEIIALAVSATNSCHY
jgi:alkylhydroperoxidase family enzyme